MAEVKYYALSINKVADTFSEVQSRADTYLMGSAQKIKSIESLRGTAHSIHDRERAEVIELLGSMNDPDATRELIVLYQDCEWRTTRLQILMALSRYPTQRGLEFLFKVAQEIHDIPLAQTAINALGQTHHPLAARFLINFYAHCNDFVRPAVVGALGQIPDRTLAPDFIQALPKALSAQDYDLVKNLVLTLGELKVKEATETLLKIAGDPVFISAQPQVALSALIAIGKITRDIQLLAPLERHYRNDAFTYQLFTSVKTQIQFRSQWRLDDYLSKLFLSNKAQTLHRTLPFELTHFKQEEVKEGLKIFRDKANLENLSQALAKLDFTALESWYGELIDWKDLTPTEFIFILKGMSNHYQDRLEPLLTSFQQHPHFKDSKVIDQWLETISLCLPNAEVLFKSFMTGGRFKQLSPAEQTQAINHLVNFGLAHQTQAPKIQAVAKILESFFPDPSDQSLGGVGPEFSAAVQARALRGLARLQASTKKTLQFALKGLSKKELAASSYTYFELCPDKSSIDPLTQSSEITPALLRALSAQTFDAKNYPLELITTGLSGKDLEISLESLRFATRHPHLSLLKPLAQHLYQGAPKGSEQERLSLGAVIAIKAHAPLAQSVAVQEQCDLMLPHLSMLLGFARESLSGRALDTLTSMKGLRAKRILIDYLRDHSDDLEVCDKLIRSFEAPETGTEYFTGIIDKILKQNPQHPRIEGLLSLLERITEGNKQTAGKGPALRGIDIQTVDRSLLEKIASYDLLDDTAKTALRSAEIPYLRPEMFDEYVDKSSSLVEYCKALDIQLEKTLGKKTLFPKLENHLHEFQSALHTAGLGEEYPSGERVLQNMGLEKHFNTHSLPVHKMSMIAHSIRTGRIVNDRFKMLDGLRAWAAILLIFGRKFGPSGAQAKPLIPIKNLNDDQLAHFCKRLIALQEVRNPAAHRQTVVQFKTIDETRSEALALLNIALKAF